MRRARRSIPGLLVGLALAGSSPGCTAEGGDSDALPDGGDGADDVEAYVPPPPQPPAAPAPVEPPLLTPCPTGWREVPADDPGGATTCDPWPEGGSATCGADEAHFPGEPGCVRIGTACPAGDWPEGLPSDRPVRYVRAGAPAGGDGTESAPFATIAEATAGAAAGTIVALARGVYDEMVTLPAGVTLWGACVAETIVACSELTDATGTVVPLGRDAEARNLTIGGNRPAVWVTGSRSIHLEDVVIADAEFLGWALTVGGRATGRSVVVRDTRSRSTDGRFGNGLHLQGGATIELTRAVVSGNREAGITARQEGTTVTLADVVVCDNTANAAGAEPGRGISLQEGAALEATRVVVERNEEIAVAVKDAGAIVRLTDTVIRDTESDGSGTVGRGLGVQVGAHAELTRVLLERNRELGIFVGGRDATLVGQDVVVRDTEGQESDGWYGHGIDAVEGATVELTRAELAGNREIGVYAFAAGTTMTLHDVIVRDTREQLRPEAEFGRGLDVEAGARVEVNRGLWSGNREAAIYAALDGTSLLLRDIEVRDTRTSVSGGGGRGIEIGEATTVEVERAVFERNRDVAVYVALPGAALRLTDAVVRDTEAVGVEQLGGRGLQVARGATAEVVRAVFERNRETNVAAYGPDTELRLRDVEIAETLERACAATSCAGLGAGIGLGAYGGGWIDAERFLVRDNALCGLQLAYGVDAVTWEPFIHGGTADLRDGEVVRHPVGANIQILGFDTARLTDRVVWRDNERVFDGTEMPVPAL